MGLLLNESKINDQIIDTHGLEFVKYDALRLQGEASR
jgi:hypothetical protein